MDELDNRAIDKFRDLKDNALILARRKVSDNQFLYPIHSLLLPPRLSPHFHPLNPFEQFSRPP
ncbi:MAG: hypothetical protein J6Y19_07915, partial [Kiritimatiellae bacterium]|nr:hypothetical protein [Kiritimatiellia bacterium]